MGHNHSHHEMKDRNLMIFILLNGLITAAQLVSGVISISLVLLSDALYIFSDLITVLVNYVTSKLSKQKASFHRTFGCKRAEILAAFINAAT